MPSITATRLTRCALTLVGVVLATTASAKEYAPAKADVIRAEGDPMNNVFVIANHLDEVTYSTDPDGANRARLKRSEVVEIDYDLRLVSTTSYLQALGQASRGNWDKAAEGFLSSTDKARFEWVAVDALFRAAEAQSKLGKHDEAAKTLEQVYIRMPKQWRVIEAMEQRGEVLLAGGKLDAANEAFGLLLSRADDFGRMCDPCEAKAMRKGLFGQAMVARKREDWSTVAKLLQRAIGHLSLPEVDAHRGKAYQDQVMVYCQTYLQLGKAQAESGDSAAALKTYKHLRFQPVPAQFRSMALLRAAELLAAKGKTMEAFDHAIMSGLVRGGTVRGEARKLANQLFSEHIENDASLDLDTKRQYKDYVSRL